MSNSTRSGLARYYLFALVILADLIFFGTFSPADSNLSIVVVGCGLLALTIYGGCSLLTSFVSQFGRIHHSSKHLSTYLAGLVIFLVLMQSIGQLTVRDSLAVALLLGLLYLYVTYLARHSPKTAVR